MFTVTGRTRKPRKGAAIIAASMHGFANCRKFESPVILTLDRVKVTSAHRKTLSAMQSCLLEGTSGATKAWSA